METRLLSPSCSLFCDFWARSVKQQVEAPVFFFFFAYFSSPPLGGHMDSPGLVQMWAAVGAVTDPGDKVLAPLEDSSALSPHVLSFPFYYQTHPPSIPFLLNPTGSDALIHLLPLMVWFLTHLFKWNKVEKQTSRLLLFSSQNQCFCYFRHTKAVDTHRFMWENMCSLKWSLAWEVIINTRLSAGDAFYFQDSLKKLLSFMLSLLSSVCSHYDAPPALEVEKTAWSFSPQRSLTRCCLWPLHQQLQTFRAVPDTTTGIWVETLWLGHAVHNFHLIRNSAAVTTNIKWEENTFESWTV